MKKMKILPPTLREKRRYVAFQVLHEEGEEVSYSDFESAFWNVFLDFYGEFGTSKMALKLLKERWNQKEKVGVVRCYYKKVPEVILGLGLISRIGDTKVTVKILGVSGTLKSLFEKLEGKFSKTPLKRK